MNPNEQADIAQWRINKHKELKAELSNNEKLKEFLADAYPNTFERFVDEYAKKKVEWIEWGPKYKKWLEQEDLQWIEDATKRLGEILQKKLFDAQCLWRAEKLAIKEVKLTKDFMRWEDNIFRCPFIEPVTESDVELYLQYLNSSNFEPTQGFLDRWQDYEGIKLAEQTGNSNRNFPDWYDFENGRTGHGVYLLLPDIRGDKEEYYLSFWRKEVQQETKERQKKWEEEKQQQLANPDMPVTPETDRRPYLQHHKKGWMTWFVNTFEDEQTRNMFKRFGGERAFDEYDDYMENDLEVLKKADRKTGLTAWFDWKEAVHKAAAQYRKEKIAEALPTAFEQYRMKIEMGFEFEENKSPFEDLWYENAILRGRELCGEARDFEF